MTNYLEEVRNQYESLPYPPRDPESEKRQLRCMWSDKIDRINFYCFEGRKDLRVNSRILVAGGGTGDSTIFLAEQLYGTDSEVVHLDICKASIDIAKKRSEVRGLNNITWIHDSILSIADIDIGEFDYINCSGVLHHLESPEKGLLALKSVLKENGAMHIMLYGKYGRSAVYQMQDLMKMVNIGEDEIDQKVVNCKKILGNLPNSNWLHQSPQILHEIQTFGDSGIYDLFLHSQDRAYTVSEVYDYIESCDLSMLSIPNLVGPGEYAYDPLPYINDSSLYDKVQKMSLKEQQIIAELLCGNIIKHSFYISKIKKEVSDIKNSDYVPCFSMTSSPDYNKEIYNKIKSSKSEKINIEFNGIKFDINCTLINQEFFKYIDGNKSTKEIIKSVRKSIRIQGNNPPSEESLFDEFTKLFKLLCKYDLLLLRSKDIAQFQTSYEMQMRVHTIYS